jgi:uncharacterized tellurite resistance protein B-like protein
MLSSLNPCPMNKDYHLGLLYLVHLLVSADGVVDDNELAALENIRKREKISDDTFREFQRDVQVKREKDIYQEGIEFLNRCSDAEKLSAFVILYKISEVDGRVHVKEVRLLLYSIKMTGIEFDDVVNKAKSSPSLY